MISQFLFNKAAENRKRNDGDGREGVALSEWVAFWPPVFWRSELSGCASTNPGITFMKGSTAPCSRSMRGIDKVAKARRPGL